MLLEIYFLVIMFLSSDFYVVPLVGRRSSFLKVKPTPATSEVASIKRLRSAPRTSSLKRKVLMDDTMVLHGEYVFMMSIGSITRLFHFNICS